jgi:hypothetical protein
MALYFYKTAIILAPQKPYHTYFCCISAVGLRTCASRWLTILYFYHSIILAPQKPHRTYLCCISAVGLRTCASRWLTILYFYHSIILAPQKPHRTYLCCISAVGRTCASRSAFLRQVCVPAPVCGQVVPAPVG